MPTLRVKLAAPLLVFWQAIACASTPLGRPSIPVAVRGGGDDAASIDFAMEIIRQLRNSGNYVIDATTPPQITIGIDGNLVWRSDSIFEYHIRFIGAGDVVIGSSSRRCSERMMGRCVSRIISDLDAIARR